MIHSILFHMNTTHFEQLLREEKAKLEQQEKETSHNDEFDNASHYFPEEEADQVEAHDIELSLEKNLEDRVMEINDALDRIAQGTYGTCERCGNEIEEARLLANPAARTHTHCETH